MSMLRQTIKTAHLPPCQTIRILAGKKGLIFFLCLIFAKLGICNKPQDREVHISSHPGTELLLPPTLNPLPPSHQTNTAVG